MKIRELKRKINKAIILFNPFLEKSNTVKENYYNWKTYCILKKKYEKKIKKLPTYKETHKYSNKVWWCWLQGEENAPALQKACISSLRKHLKDREIIVITLDNLYEYIDFPDYIIEKYKKGIIPNANFSDMIRLQLLIKYGGTWIDSTVYCTKYNKDFFDRDLFVFKAFMRGDDSIVSSSWFITAEINNPILLTVRDLFFDYWKTHDYLIHYLIFHLLFTIATEKYPKLFEKVENFPNVSPHVMQFELLNEYNEKRFKELEQFSDFHKLSRHLDFESVKNKNTIYNYIIDRENANEK